jgi:hypothetical protein
VTNRLEEGHRGKENPHFSQRTREMGHPGFINVPDALHRHLRAHAAMAGMSLSDYLLAELKEIGERPTLAELRERLHRRKPVLARFDSARLVRQERGAR